MALNISVPWKIHLSGAGSRSSAGKSWWSRRKYRDDPAHPTLMEEQDLDHLGALHEKVIHPKKR